MCTKSLLNPILVILGGFGLGNAAGLLAHYGRTLSGDSPPSIDVPLAES